MRNIFNIVEWTPDGTLRLPNGLSYGQFTGPLYVALLALQKAGQLPENVTAQDITQLKLVLQNDLQRYDLSSKESWQQTYFAIDLAVLCSGIA